MPITDWPVDERPREKLLDRGAGALTDAELLAIFLRTGVSGMSAVSLARQLLDDYGGLTPLLAADRDEFCQGHGLGTAKFVQLQAVVEMARRYLAERLDRSEPLTDPAATRDYLIARLARQPHEVFAALFLDTRHRVLAYEELFRGTIDGAAVYPREVVKAALRHNAAAAIFAHNHPSGIAEPSEADHSLTRRLSDALALVDIRTLDHFVIGAGETVSFAERGWL
ncbi:RadC family protein [Spectribacter hydrogenooxidans]|uniref:DNA repair protein RadC n=1 Tax=Spectribacter hydrogenoxidans TaxID=3075608 RepID=A0ABU3BYM8_9GAMM|nr:DNA repair protein RadC [Salinisphaera sp. W335]MDT0634421.1 DNA repair protein RadC [Salinisphaera sp. W335]